MSLKEWFDTWEINPVLFTMATNGLDYEKDKILGFTMYFPEEDKKEIRLIETSGVDLLKSQPIHMISESDMSFLSMPEPVQRIYMESVMDKYTIFTYNVPFYYGFITNFIEDRKPRIYDLSVIEQALRKEHKAYEDDLVNFNSWYSCISSYYDPLTVRSICRVTGLNRMPSPGQFPMERMMELLISLYTSASSREILLSRS